MTAEIIQLRRAGAPGETPIEAKPTEIYSEEMFDRRERAVVDAMEHGDLRRAIIHFSALVAMNVRPFATKALEATRDMRLAALLDHIEQAARRHYRGDADEETR